MENDKERKGLTKAIFRCDFCGESAATVEFVAKGVPHPNALLNDAGAGTIIISGFYGLHREVVMHRHFGVIMALIECNPRPLYAVDELWAPFYCPECDRSYCIKHWDIVLKFDNDFMPGWYDCSYGTCPKGHKRMVDD